MIIPPLQGKLSQAGFFIYAACDTHYFDDFGKALIGSVLKNTNVGIHLHIFNPREDQITYCLSNARISVTYEETPNDAFDVAANRWNVVPTDATERFRLTRILTAMNKGGDASVVERMKKTYYACARFIRLADIISDETQCFAMDVDAIVRRNIEPLPRNRDCYLHMITGGNDPRILAGGIFMTGMPAGYQFVKEYSMALTNNINNDYLYWGIDQDILKQIAPKYNVGQLPENLIDWRMRPTSTVWTAKGQRKDLHTFVTEQKKYTT